MNEEIDIIELLKRVKEGKAPKEIEIEGVKYHYNEEWYDVFYSYLGRNDKKISQNFLDFDTKIKILDEHKIEKLEEKICGISLGDTNRTLLYVIKKINEIIEKINGEEK